MYCRFSLNRSRSRGVRGRLIRRDAPFNYLLKECLAQGEMRDCFERATWVNSQSCLIFSKGETQAGLLLSPHNILLKASLLLNPYSIEFIRESLPPPNPGAIPLAPMKDDLKLNPNPKNHDGNEAIMLMLMLLVSL